MRHISPDTFSDPVFGIWAHEYQLLWIGLIVVRADDQGRMVDNAALMAAELFPYDQRMDDRAVEFGLDLFRRWDKIIRYAAGGNGSGRRLIQIRKWWKYQSSAQWASRSKFPAPDGWIDRVRMHQGHPIITPNWDLVGGLRTEGGAKKRPITNDGPAQALRRTSTGPSKAQEEDDINNEDEVNKDKNIPPSLPSSRRGAAKADGRMEAYARLTTEQLRDAERIEKILDVASFSDRRKAILLSALVATRSCTGGPIHHVVASFASTFAGGKSRDPVAVAVHQLQENKVNPAFNDPKTWNSVPREILKAAGIDDLRAYATQHALSEFTGA